MTEVISASPELTQVQEIIEQDKFGKKRTVLKVVMMFKTDKHVALKIIDHPHFQFYHLASAFSRTEYAPEEIPSSKMEIKIEEDNLTDDNIADALIKHLYETFPATQNLQVNVYDTPRSYATNKPIKISLRKKQQKTASAT